MEPRVTRSWLLLIHQVPAKPDYLRVKVGRRLQRVGAVAVKAGVYAMPDTEETREDLAWIAREVTDGGGEAQIVEAKLVDGLDDTALVERFRLARDEDAAPLVEALKALDEREDDEAELKRVRKRLDEIVQIDFFGSTKVLEAKGWLERIEARRRPAAEPAAPRAYRGQTWVTRAGVGVDRMASAWLVRRFVDSDAAFRFVPGKAYAPRPGELRFDMYEAEFGHEGDQCTFEVLMRRMGLDDPALVPIAEMVHDADCKDAKFGRPEGPGFQLTVDAIAAAHPEDEDRLQRASAWLDDLYALFQRR
jgi:hypothetical protein